MSLPLTGLIIICGLTGSEVTCQANVYHNMAHTPAVREACPQVINLVAAKFEGLREGQGLPGELDALMAKELPFYMRDTWGATSVNVVHHDADTGQITDPGRWIAM